MDEILQIPFNVMDESRTGGWSASSLSYCSIVCDCSMAAYVIRGVILLIYVHFCVYERLGASIPIIVQSFQQDTAANLKPYTYIT